MYLMSVHKHVVFLLVKRDKLLTWLIKGLLQQNNLGSHGCTSGGGKAQPTTVEINRETTQCGGGHANRLGGERNLDPNDNCEPFSRCGTEWLDSNQILKCSLYLLHTQYQGAKHQNIYGLTHTHSSNEEFLQKLGKAANNRRLDHSTCIAQAMRDAMSVDGPCPAVVVGDDTHFRTVFINARTKSVSLVDPFGHGFSEEIKDGIMDLYSKDKSGTWSFNEWKVELQHDSYNCGVWAIWMHEKWMQYWLQDQISVSFETWFAQTNQDAIPSASSLRERYYDQMQMATNVGTDGKTGFRRSKDSSEVRMANHRDRQQLTELHIGRTLQGMQPDSQTHGALKSFDMSQTARHQQRVRQTLHTVKGKVCKPKTTRRIKSRQAVKASSVRPANNKQKGSAGLLKTWLQTTAPTNSTENQTDKTTSTNMQDTSNRKQTKEGRNATAGVQKGTIKAYFHSTSTHDTKSLKETRQLPPETMADEHPSPRKQAHSDEIPDANTEKALRHGLKTQSNSKTGGETNSKVEVQWEARGQAQNPAQGTAANNLLSPSEGQTDRSAKKQKSEGG
ncbi:hypothetical protein ABBQ38_011564 [Trebouxia sp. C0009 RCD-2024]